jgi:hypothetical protein
MKLPLFALLPALLLGCDGAGAPTGTVGNRTAADACLNAKISELARIDHQTPSADAIRSLAAFCWAEYGWPDGMPAGFAERWTTEEEAS